MGRKTGRRGFFGRKKESALQVLPYRIRGNFLSPEQASYFKMILSAVGDTFAVCPRVYLADVLSVTQDEADQFKERLYGIQIDFLICDRDTLLPLAAVVLSGEKEVTDDLRERDFFLDDVFDAAKLPLVRFFTGNPCSPGDLRECLLEVAESAGPKPSDGLLPANCPDLEKKTLEEKLKSWQQPEQDYQESGGHAEEPLQEAALKQEEPQPEPETVEKTHQEIERYEPVPEEHSTPDSTSVPPLKQPLEDLRQPPVNFMLPGEPAPQPEPETVEKTHQEIEQYEPVPEEHSTPDSTWVPLLKQPLEDLRQPEATFMPSEDAAPLEAARELIKEKHEEDTEKAEPLHRPAVLRFLHSEQEQTPGIDFFTGSLSDIAPPLVEHKDVTEDGGIELGQVKSNDRQSDAEAEKNEEKVPATVFSAELPDLEQLKAKMKQEVELAAREALQSGAPECPRCTATMVLRTSKRGYRFYVCANYPHCREVKGLYE